MLYEYAVEPDCFADGQNFRYLTEGFGVSKGRLISLFPKNWGSQFVEIVENSPDGWVKGQQLTDRLTYLKKHAFIRSGRDYEPALSWVENAKRQHERGKPFRAVLVKDSTGHPDYVLTASRIDETNAQWKTKKDDRVLRTAIELGKAVGLLLRMSKQIYFVDKMFASQLNDEGRGKERWLATLAHFIQIAVEDRDVLPELEYHSEGKVLSDAEQEKFVTICRCNLQNVLQAKTSLRLRLWTNWHDGSDFFHARYILTERGGIRIDWGLDEGKAKGKTEQRTDVSLLDHEMWDELWRLFQPKAETFQELPYEIVVSR